MGHSSGSNAAEGYDSKPRLRPADRRRHRPSTDNVILKRRRREARHKRSSTLLPDAGYPLLPGATYRPGSSGAHTSMALASKAGLEVNATRSPAPKAA